MKHLILLPLFATLALAADWLVTADLNGTLTITRDKQTVATAKPHVTRAGWRNQDFGVDFDLGTKPGRFTGRAGEKGKPETVELTFTYSQTAPNTLTLRYEFTPTTDIYVHALKTSLNFDSELLKGHTYTFANKTTGTLPVQNNPDVVHLARTNDSALDLSFPEGPLHFTLNPANSMLIQDNRRWTHNYFEFRYACKPANATRTGEGTVLYKGGSRYVADLALTFPGPFTLKPLTPIVMKADDTWIPLDNRLDIEPGSALDFTSVIGHDAPAGKHGWTRADGQNFVFEKLPGKPQRFYGVNFCGSANTITHEQADILADRLARFGYNAVRFHHYERPLVNNNRKDSSIPDPQRLDNFDYLFAALKKRGIYMTTDLYVSRSVNAHEVYPGRKGAIAMNEFKRLCPVNANARATWKRFAKNLLGHVNPYTGLTLAEDPALNVIALINEGVIGDMRGDAFPELFQADWLAAWNKWLGQRFPTPEARATLGLTEFPTADLPKSGNDTPLNRAAAHFFYDIHQDMYRDFTSYLRNELHCQALFTDMNHSGRRLWAQSTRATFDYVDDHFYIDHPRFLATKWRLPSTCDNLSIIKTGRFGGQNCAFTRFLDRPFTITEWNYSGPGRYRGIGGIMTGCLASIQNWAGLWRFAYSHSDKMFSPEERTAGYFDVVADPFAQVTERATLCLFLRGDLPAATHTLAVTIDQNWAADTSAPEVDLASAWGGYALLAKVGSFLGKPNTPVPADISFQLTPNAPKAPRNDAQTGADALGSDAANRLADTVRQLRWLPDGNQTDLARKIFHSADGQFLVNGANNSMTLNTPMTAGGFAEAGQTVATDAATFQIRDADATVWVSSVTTAPIRSSRRLLLSHVTELHNTDQRYADENRRTVLAWGKTPHLVRQGTVHAELKLEHPEAFTVYRLDLAGKRLGTVPARAANGALVFDLAINHDGKAQLLYEIVR